MTTKSSAGSEVPRTVSAIQKLLKASLHEVVNIVNVINGGGEDRLVALDRNIFQGAEIALMPYNELLTKDYRFRQDDGIDKVFIEFTNIWTQLAQALLKVLPVHKETQRFAIAWRKANDELCCILKREKGRDENSDRIYNDFITSLDNVAELMARQKVNSAKSRGKPKRGRQGSGLKGKKTKRMDEQLSEFKTWILDNHPIDERKVGWSIGERANQFWNTRRKTFEKDKARQGEKRGYSCSKALASAYRNNKQ
ncbi:MAG: hypothetical protein K6G91_14510 [Kiritimatiellae bacterium]|nr:hypothetical protein [Kiritimatiellia bacterium]